MKDYKDEAFDELEKAQQRKVATGVTDGSKVTIDRAKLEQVLEALRMADELFDERGIDFKEYGLEFDKDIRVKYRDAITAIKEALEDV